ncbi:hypothetical protein JMJ35_000420 [Cladonia borealis]|uniref:Uncharacterized protein n=1 Tax=Cladonia borealis TaxID=184061 RepID=A0AA39RAX2_9LECA|nr:hypothetical protein JMJ35_000420 [Cladonia borealis]
MDCEPAEVGSLSNSLIERPWVTGVGAGILADYLVGDVSGPGCQLLNVSLGQTPGHMYFTKNLNISSGWKSNYQGFFDYYIYNSGFNYVDAENPAVPQPNATPEDYRVDLYTIKLAPLNQTLVKAEKLSNTSNNLSGFNMTDLLDGIVDSLTLSNLGEGGADYVTAPVPSMFMLLEGLLGDSNNISGLEPLIQLALLRDLSTQALQGIGTQYAEQFLKQDQGQSKHTCDHCPDTSQDQTMEHGSLR